MNNDRSTDDDVDEYWQRVHDADTETQVESAGGDPGVKTDPDEVQVWAEERDAVPVNDPDINGPEAYALRHENVVDGSAHRRVSWEDFAAAFRGETDDESMEFHHDDDEAGTHRFVTRSEGDARAERAGDRGMTGTAEDEGRPDEARGSEDRPADAETDIGGVETDAGSDHSDTATTGDDEGTVTGDREGGIESGADAGTETADGADWILGDVNEGDSVIDNEGETIGIVTAVEGNEIYVDPDPGITEKLSAKLGWVDEDDAEYTVEADDVAGVEDGDVHLKPATL